MHNEVVPKRLNRSRILLRAVTFCLCGSILVALAMIAQHKGFGASDAWPFLIWSVPFSMGLAILILWLIKLFSRFSPYFSYVIAVILGALSGVLWTSVVGVWLGPWLMAFSFPVSVCWMAGGASGLISIAGVGSKMRRVNNPAELTLLLIICLITTLGTPRFMTWVTNDQRLELVFVLWRKGPESLTIQGPFDDKFMAAELAQMKAAGLTGQLTVVQVSEHGTGRRSRAVIVMHRRPDSSTELLQPDGTNVLYLQQEELWVKYPPTAPTLQRTIRLEVSQSRGTVEYWVDRGDGTRQGGTAY